MPRPSVDELRCRFAYNPETGELAPKGKQPPARKRDGYWSSYVDGKYMRQHIIIWCLMTGEYPKTTIDHKDRDGFNNSWNNLREATQSQQQVNRRIMSKSGFRGVYPCGKKWEAQIFFDKKTRSLGVFDTPEEAAEVVQLAREARWGEFASAA